MTKITEHFSLSEFERSNTARKYNIDNTIPASAVANITTLCHNVLEPLRQHVGEPVEISSGYRCPALNAKVGGSSTSQHMKGEAADIVAPRSSPQGGKITLLRWFLWIMDNCEFDQLILEHFPSPPGGKKGGPWIHVSYRAGHNRQVVKFS